MRAAARRWAVLVGGWALLVAGALLLVLPGPGIPLVIGGLALLGRESPWARRLCDRLQARAARLRRQLRSRFSERKVTE
ncbi:MAG TPA: PGPGW domain-containing protein [Anaeromyxobacteraceae bacterium]|nr:PGPGW domain-containing protein [Anaeromyxobacteraceae bacterium]